MLADKILSKSYIHCRQNSQHWRDLWPITNQQIECSKRVIGQNLKRKKKKEAQLKHYQLGVLLFKVLCVFFLLDRITILFSGPLIGFKKQELLPYGILDCFLRALLTGITLMIHSL